MTEVTTSAADVTWSASTDDNVDIADFTLKRKLIRFRVDNDIFEGYAVLGIPMLQELITVAKTSADLVTNGNYEAFCDVFDKLLLPASAVRFRERVTSRGTDAIDVREQLIPIMHYILEQHGVRPTQLSSDSSTG